MPRKPKPVAMFNSKLILVAIFPSINGAALAIGMPRQSIIKNIQGVRVAAKKHYWRVIPPDFIIDQDDIGTLSLIDFDKEVGNSDRFVWQRGKNGHKTKVYESRAHNPSLKETKG